MTALGDERQRRQPEQWCKASAAAGTADLAPGGREGGGGPAAAWVPTAPAQGDLESRRPGLGRPRLGQLVGWEGRELEEP